MSDSLSPGCQWLLADRGLTPIISTASLPSSGDSKPSKQAQAQLRSLTSLTATAITAFESSSRLGLGIPQRIIVETQSSGPVILHSFLNPPPQRRAASRTQGHSGERGILEQARDELRPLTATTDAGSEGHGGARFHANGILGKSTISAGNEDEDEEEEDEDNNNSPQSPLLIASIIAPNVAEARKAAGFLERTGQEIQKELALEQQRQQGLQHSPDRGEDG